MSMEERRDRGASNSGEESRIPAKWGRWSRDVYPGRFETDTREAEEYDQRVVASPELEDGESGAEARKKKGRGAIGVKQYNGVDIFGDVARGDKGYFVCVSRRPGMCPESGELQQYLKGRSLLLWRARKKPMTDGHDVFVFMAIAIAIQG